MQKRKATQQEYRNRRSVDENCFKNKRNLDESYGMPILSSAKNETNQSLFKEFLYRYKTNRQFNTANSKTHVYSGSKGSKRVKSTYESTHSHKNSSSTNSYDYNKGSRSREVSNIYGK